MHCSERISIANTTISTFIADDFAFLKISCGLFGQLPLLGTPCAMVWVQRLKEAQKCVFQN